MRAFSLLIVAASLSIVVCLMFDGAVLALEQNEASASAYWTNQPFYQGGNTTASITFISNSSDALTVYFVGIHFDWMPSDSFVGLNLSNNPVNITSNGSHTFNPMIILFPANATVGSHSYFIGIDGTQGNFEGFSWSSPPFNLQILPTSVSTPTPTPTPTPNSGGGDQSTLLLLIVGATIIVIVIVLLLFMILKRKRKPSQQPTVTPSQTVTPPEAVTPPRIEAPPQPATSEVSQPSLSRDTVARLERLKELMNKNLITKDEYEKKKSEILSEV